MSSVKKRSMTALDLASLLHRLRNIVEGSYVVNVFQSGEVLALQMRREGLRFYLLMSPRHGVLETDWRPEQPGSLPPFCATLRRLVRRARVEAVYQGGLDRVLYLRMFNGATLVYEGVREGNILLVNGNGVIEAALRERQYRDRVVKRAEPYVPPPKVGVDPLAVDPNDLVARLRGKTLATAIAREVNAPGDAIHEALYRAGLSAKLPPSSVLNSDIEEFAERLREVYVEALQGKRGYIVSTGRAEGVYPFRPTHLGEWSEEGDFYELAIKYFSEIVKAQLKPRLGSDIREHILRKAAEKAEAARKLRRIAEAIFANLTAYESVIRDYWALRNSSTGWDAIKRLLSKRYSFVVDVDPGRNAIEVEVEGEKVKLNASLSAAQNASRLFEEAKELEREYEKAVKMAEEKACKELSAVPRLVKLEKGRKWYEGYLYFVSSEGFLVVGGRDASQNEALVKKYMGPDDLFFHADIHGGPVVIVKTEGRKPGENTIEEAAQLAAAYSRAWQLGLASVDVYWVYGKQVSKKAPSGEYLGKGAFMVYGKRNYLHSVPLRVAVGVSLKGGTAKLLAGPPRAVTIASVAYVVLAPGRMPREAVAAKVARWLAGALRDVKVKIEISDVVSRLPRGSFYILEMRRGDAESRRSGTPPSRGD